MSFPVNIKILYWAFIHSINLKKAGVGQLKYCNNAYVHVVLTNLCGSIFFYILTAYWLPHRGRLSYGRSPRLLWQTRYACSEIACKQTPGEDEKKFGEHKTEEFGERSDWGWMPVRRLAARKEGSIVNRHQGGGRGVKTCLHWNAGKMTMIGPSHDFLATQTQY